MPVEKQARQLSLNLCSKRREQGHTELKSLAVKNKKISDEFILCNFLLYKYSQYSIPLNQLFENVKVDVLL